MTRAKRMLSKQAMASIALTVALVIPAGAWALGLGEARVESFLNQPLDVRMRLLDVSDDDLDSLTVTPASPEDFERLGLMSSSLALGIQIEVDRSVSPPIVRVTSARPVSDPVVQLLVDARWASGRMLREYTLFLDPPTVAVEAPAPARPAQQDEPAADRRTAAPVRQTEAPRARESRPQQAQTQQTRAVAASGSRRYGPVASGDTLWSIARANLPAGDVSMNQMMIAIVELNPDAFRDRNINQLLRGAELQLPDAEQVRALDEAAAAAEVAAQNRAFSRRMSSDLPTVSSAGRDSGPTTESPAARDMAGRPEQAESADPVDHRLSLVPPGDEESGNGLSEDAAEVADLRQRLARAEEELYAARQEAEEFQSRVEDLETAIRDNPGGIGLRDAELAGLEATLRAAREATREDADPELRAEVSERLEGYLAQYEAASQAGSDGDQAVSAESDPAGDEGMIGAQDDAAAQAPDEEATAADAAAEDAEPTPAPERAVTEIQSSKGLLGNPMLLLVVGLVVLLAILAIVRFLVRRGRESAEPGTPLKRAAELSPTTQSTENPIQTARAQLNRNPDDLAAHLGLLQTLASDGNQDEFGEALEAMYVHVDSDSDPEWREALDLAGRVVPGHPLVKGSTDWVAEGPVRDVDELPSEVDEESEVDDLMTRLDSDLDESDDRDWLGEETPDEPDGPLLRGDDDAGADVASDRGEDLSPGVEGSKSRPDEFEEEFDFGDWGDEEEGPEDESESGLQTDAPDQPPEAGKDEDLVLDWPDEEEPVARGDAGDAAPGSEGVEADDRSADGEETADDIFAPSDDDIDVKLDLAKAYLSWNSTDSARTLLEEVAREGNESQRDEARKLLDDLSDGSDD
ncbi:MAG: hypothetical protein CMP07_07350 [Xanthomonadales bacterium]|nr:hypothetical protein [Xanthomonadales bacterium]